MIYFDADMTAEIIERDIIEQIIYISKGNFRDYETYIKTLKIHNEFVEKQNSIIVGKPFNIKMYLKRHIFSEKKLSV